MIALVSLTGMPYVVLMPVFAKEVLHGGAHTFGFLMTASGCGALIGTVYLASRKSVVGLGRLIVITSVMFAAGIAVFAVSTNITLSLVSLAVAGFGAMTFAASCNTILQTILEESMRGRVMSFFALAFVGIAPFGSFGAGAMADTIGPRDTLLIGAACCLVGAVLFARKLPNIREKVRPIYVKMGIIKEVAEGMEEEAEQPPMPDGLE